MAKKQSQPSLRRGASHRKAFVNLARLVCQDHPGAGEERDVLVKLVKGVCRLNNWDPDTALNEVLD